MIQHHAITIKKIVPESGTTKTFVFDYPLHAAPGQFIMLTDFETGEKPFSLSYLDAKRFAVTMKKVGAFTTKLLSLNEGDTLYFRGPYGNGFSLPEETKRNKLLIAGGGCGIAPLRYLIQTLLKNKNVDITLLLGGKTKTELLFHDELHLFPMTLRAATDDGSHGTKGNILRVLSAIEDIESFDYYYMAGPEPMLKATYNYLKQFNVNGEYLLERYMKCGVGICGQCTVDPIGIRICVEGPVIKKDMLSTLTEFGNYTRNAYGKRVPFLTCL